MAVPKRRPVPLPSNLEASRMPWRSRWTLPVPATVRQRLYLTAPSVTMAMGPTSVACVSVILVVWAHDASAPWGTTVHRMMSTASRSQRARSAAGGVTVCVDSAPAMQMSLVRCGASTVNVTTSIAYASKGHCALIMGSVAVASASVTLAGQEKTATAPQSQSPAHPATTCCAAAGVTAIVGFVNALSLALMETPVRNALPVLIPALLKRNVLSVNTLKEDSTLTTTAVVESAEMKSRKWISWVSMPEIR